MNYIKKIINGYKLSKWIDELKLDKSHFVPITDMPYIPTKNTPKIFAYYLPQFHCIPENDDAHGKGFTEWTNVANCAPQFYGHHQPKIPYDVGFYDLNNIDVMYRQAELAKLYGIYGFCFYYYWFSGKRLLYKPLDNFLNSDIDLHFHFCWANENWSKLWDGGNKEIIVKQEIKDNEAKKFFKDLLPFIKDKRYEKINNKPILMIYNPTLFNKDLLKKFLTELNELAKKEGFDGFFFTASDFKKFNTPTEWGFDAITEFPPHTFYDIEEKKCIKFSEKANFHVFNIDNYIKNKKFIYPANYTIFKACFPSWDNSPRKTYSHGFCFEMSDGMFERWLSDIIKWTKENNPKNQQYIYINAWNEWAEGAMLEPDIRNGYKNLNIVKTCLEKFDK